MHTKNLLLRRQIGLGLALVVIVAMLMGTVALMRGNWTAIDAKEWNTWYPSNETADADPNKTVLYTEVDFRIEENYVYGMRNGRVVLRTRLSDDVTTGPTGYQIENGWVSRTIGLFKQGVFTAAARNLWRQQWLHSFWQQELVYEYICPSQEIRQIESRLQSQEGLKATVFSFHTSGGAGWSSRLEGWTDKVNGRQIVPLLNPLAPIWPSLCGETHLSWKLYAQQQLAHEKGYHRIWIPLPDKIEDPTRGDATYEDAPMDICAEQVPDGALTCLIFNSGDSPTRHALLLKPGRYRFFQRLHGEPQQEGCGNLIRGFGNSGPCNDGKRWYWRKTLPPHAPEEVQLQDLGPGTSVGPQIRSFELDA